MKILSKYFFKEYFKIFAICQIAFFTIYLLIDFLGKIDNFIEARVSNGVMFAYFILKGPLIVVQMTPVASLISVIILLCFLKRNNEIMALRASGYSIFRLSRPVFSATFFLAAGLFLLSEMIVPYTSSKCNEIWAIEVEKRDPTRFYESNQIWYRGEGVIYWARHFDFKSKTLQSPSLYFFDETFRLVKKMDAREGKWKEGKWRFENGIIQELTPEGDYGLDRFTEYDLDLPETPETFTRIEKKPEEMSYWQLKAYAEKVRQEGYDDTKYLVDMHIKLALPLIGLILAFSGIPIAIRIGQSAPLAISSGMGICFLYMLILGFSRSLGISGTLPPLLSAWLASGIFFLLGVYLMINIER